MRASAHCAEYPVQPREFAVGLIAVIARFGEVVGLTQGLPVSTFNSNGKLSSQIDDGISTHCLLFRSLDLAYVGAESQLKPIEIE